MTRELKVGVIPGDGVGHEVVPATLPLLNRAASLDGCDISYREFDWGAARFLETGAMMPSDAPEQLRGLDGVLFGAVGHPDVPDHETSWGLILPLRQRLGLYANVRPVRSWPGVKTPVRDSEGSEIVVVRENAEGEYAGIGGSVAPQPGEDIAVEVAVHTRAGIERIASLAFEIASRRDGRLTVATKSNSLRFGYVLWDKVIEEMAADHPDVVVEYALVDSLAMRVIKQPRSLSVIVASNLFGDILSDLASVLAGSLGLAPSANQGLPGSGPNLYEPVHGSAPDIAGKGIANPCACVLSAAMMLEDCGAGKGANALREAVAQAVADPANHTPDLGGEANTAQISAAIEAAIPEQVPT